MCIRDRTLEARLAHRSAIKERQKQYDEDDGYLEQVEEEEARVGRELDRRREASRSNDDGNGRERRRGSDGDDSVDGAGPPGWMTATVGFVLAILGWSATGLIFSPDPAVGPPLTPEQVEEQLAVRGYDAKRFD